jgi:hypothetical protein
VLLEALRREAEAEVEHVTAGTTDGGFEDVKEADFWGQDG